MCGLGGCRMVTKREMERGRERGPRYLLHERLHGGSMHSVCIKEIF